MQADWKAAETSADVQVHRNIYFCCLPPAIVLFQVALCNMLTYEKVIHQNHIRCLILCFQYKRKELQRLIRLYFFIIYYTPTLHPDALSQTTCHEKLEHKACFSAVCDSRNPRPRHGAFSGGAEAAAKDSGGGGAQAEGC